jgi:hypothetical protein
LSYSPSSISAIFLEKWMSFVKQKAAAIAFDGAIPHALFKSKITPSQDSSRNRMALRRTVSMNVIQQNNLFSQIHGFVLRDCEKTKVSIDSRCNDPSELRKLSHAIDRRRIC